MSIPEDSELGEYPRRARAVITSAVDSSGCELQEGGPPCRKIVSGFRATPIEEPRPRSPQHDNTLPPNEVTTAATQRVGNDNGDDNRDDRPTECFKRDAPIAGNNAPVNDTTKQARCQNETRDNPPVIAYTATPTSHDHPYEKDALDQLIQEASRRFEASTSWKEFAEASRDPRGDIHPDVRHLEHPAAELLEQLRVSGAPVKMKSRPWSKAKLKATLARGPHKSAEEYISFLRGEFVDMINKGHWTMLPAALLENEIELRLSPIGVVPQRERRPRTICDYTFFGVNEDTEELAPKEAMQFGKALQRMLQRIHQANPRYGPVYVSKIDISDGFYRVFIRPEDVPKMGMLFPTRPDEPDLIAFPLTSPMGWKESPPWFSTATETTADLANHKLTYNTPLAPHRLDELAESIPPDEETSANNQTKTATAKPNEVAAAALDQNEVPTNDPKVATHLSGTVNGKATPPRSQANTANALPPPPQIRSDANKKPLQCWDVYVDDFVGLVQGSKWKRRHVKRALLHSLDAALRGLDEHDMPHRQEPASIKKLKKGDATWTTSKIVLGWLINTLNKTINLPSHRIERLFEMLNSIRPNQRRVSTKTWHKVLGELRSMAIATPGARGLFCTPQEAFRHPDGHKGRLKLRRQQHDFLLDFKWLADNLKNRATRIAELVPNKHPSTLGACDAAGPGMGGIHFVPIRKGRRIVLCPFLWRAPFPKKIQDRIVSDNNPQGDITNSELELAGSIAHVDVLTTIADVREETVHNFYDNIPTVYWQRKGSTTTAGPAAYLLRLQSIHQRHYRYVPLHDYVPGPANVMADVCSRRTLELMPTAQANTLRADFSLVQEAIRDGVTSKRSSAQDHHWERWNEFCFEYGIDPFLRQFKDPVPLLQIFGQQYRDGRRAPSGNTVRSRTVEDAIRAVGQKFTIMGANDPRKDLHGNIDFRMQRQLKAWSKKDAPPARVKPIPITVILFILNVAHGHSNCQLRKALADLITIAFFFLLRPGEYTGTTTDDAAFELTDVALYLDQEKLHLLTSPLWKLENATSVKLTFTTQKNGRRGDIIAHTRSGHPLCCPVLAIVRRVLHHRQHNSSMDTVLASFYQQNKFHLIKAKQITDELRSAVSITSDETGLSKKDVSARSLRAGGAMALLCGNIDADLIKLLGRWHSDAMMRYLHQESQPIIKRLATAMFNNGKYDFLPDETVPVNPQE